LGLPWHPTIHRRALYATQGTVAAAHAALRDGIAANLAGGTHHAFPDRGEGFCVFNDVAVAIRELQSIEPWLQIMVIDLDAHQGNATHAIFKHDPNVMTYSAHVGRNYPSRKEPGTLDIELSRFASEDEFFSRVEPTLLESIQRFEPDLVFYIAGADTHHDDRYGQMSLSTRAMKQRDQMVLHNVRRWGVPCAVVYGGGYNRTQGMTAYLHTQSVCVAAQQFARERNLAPPTLPDLHTLIPLVLPQSEKTNIHPTQQPATA
jgi:acetoin utilization deacetylase AcuC-like enzyme